MFFVSLTDPPQPALVRVIASRAVAQQRRVCGGDDGYLCLREHGAVPHGDRGPENMLLDSAVKGLLVSDQYRDAALEHLWTPLDQSRLRFALSRFASNFMIMAWANTFDVLRTSTVLDEEYDILYSSDTILRALFTAISRNLLISGTEKMEFEGVVLTSTPLPVTITTVAGLGWCNAVIMFNAERNELIRDYAITHAILVPAVPTRACPILPDNCSAKWLFYQCTIISRHEREDSGGHEAQLLEFYGDRGWVATTLIA